MAFKGAKQKTRKGFCLDCERVGRTVKVRWIRSHSKFHLVEAAAGTGIQDRWQGQDLEPLHMPCPNGKCGHRAQDQRCGHSEPHTASTTPASTTPDSVAPIGPDNSAWTTPQAPVAPSQDVPRQDDDTTLLDSVARALAASLAVKRDLDALRKHVDTKTDNSKAARVIKVDVSGRPDDAPPLSPSDLAHESMALLLHAVVRSGPKHHPNGVFLHGEPGTGKSHAAEAVARVLGVPFYEQSLGPSDTKAAIVGTILASGPRITTPIREAWRNGGVLLLDEVCTANPAVLTQINNATESGRLICYDETIEAHPDLKLILADNTDGENVSAHYPTRRIMDPAFRGRFARIHWAADHKLSAAVAKGLAAGDDVALAECLTFYNRIRAREWPVPVTARSLYQSVGLTAHSDLKLADVKALCYPSAILEAL
jgi:hypothetical protein